MIGTAKAAARLEIGAGAAKLIEGPTVSPDATGRPEGFDDEFGEGQMSGPNGPKFVGFGVPVPRQLWRDIVENFAFGIGVGATIFALMFITL